MKIYKNSNPLEFQGLAKRVDFWNLCLNNLKLIFFKDKKFKYKKYVKKFSSQIFKNRVGVSHPLENSFYFPELWWKLMWACVRGKIINLIYHHQFMIYNNIIYIFIALCASSKANFQGLWALGKNVNVNVEVNENSTWFFFSQMLRNFVHLLAHFTLIIYTSNVMKSAQHFVCAFTFILIHNFFCEKFFNTRSLSIENPIRWLSFQV